MKKMFFFAAIASVAFASCTNDESVFDGAVNGNEINFAVAQYTPQTRAEHGTGDPFNENITIWSWYDGENTPVIPGDIYNPETKTFPDSRKYYWPIDGSALDFVAVPTAFVGTYFTAPVRAAGGTTTLTCTIDDSDDYHGKNIMTTEVETASSGTVALLFRHLLSKIKINVAQKERETTDARWLVTINKIQVDNLKCAGEVVINDSWDATDGDATDGDQLWDTTTGDETWVVTNTDKPLYESLNTGAATPYTSADTYYMLPQTLETGVQQITIDYTIKTNYLGNDTQPDSEQTYSKTFDLKDVTAITHWAMNKVITYNISIDPSKTLDAIEFSVNEEEWGTPAGSYDF